MPLKGIRKYSKSYRAGLLQAKAFRILKKHTNDALASHHLNATDWGILGLLHENTQAGIPFKQLALEMGVKPPFVTRSISKLADRKMVTIKHSPTDGRSRLISITKTGSKFVEATEPMVMNMILETLRPAGKMNIYGYLSTLIAIVNQESSQSLSDTDLDHLQEEE